MRPLSLIKVFFLLYYTFRFEENRNDVRFSHINLISLFSFLFFWRNDFPTHALSFHLRKQIKRQVTGFPKGIIPFGGEFEG